MCKNICTCINRCGDQSAVVHWQRSNTATATAHWPTHRPSSGLKSPTLQTQVSHAVYRTGQSACRFNNDNVNKQTHPTSDDMTCSHPPFRIATCISPQHYATPTTPIMTLDPAMTHLTCFFGCRRYCPDQTEIACGAASSVWGWERDLEQLNGTV